MAIILDNASIHRSKTVKDFTEKFPELKLYALPTYSPEHNPIEMVWRWIKPMVYHGQTIKNGLQELLHRFRQLMFSWRNNKLAKNPNFGTGVWQDLLFKYL